MTAFQKCRKWQAMLSSVLCIGLIGYIVGLWSKSGDNVQFYNLIFGAMGVLIGTFVTLLDTFALIDAKRRGIPALKIYEDRIEFRKNALDDRYDVYYFQDISSVEVQGTDFVLTFVNNDTRKIDFNELDCYMYDFFDGIKAKYEAFRNENPLSSDDDSVRMKSRIYDDRDVKSKAEKIQKCCGIIAWLFAFIAVAPMQPIVEYGLIDGWRMMEKDDRDIVCIVAILVCFFACIKFSVSRRKNNKDNNKTVREKW